MSPHLEVDGMGQGFGVCSDSTLGGVPRQCCGVECCGALEVRPSLIEACRAMADCDSRKEGAHAPHEDINPVEGSGQEPTLAA